MTKASTICNESYMQIKEAINTKISDILKDYYIIPRFQRKYVWTKNEVTEFFNDINENPAQYFIGSLVLYNYKNEDNERQDAKGIVDGQQRLTTILILLVELRRLFFNIANKGNENLKLEAEKKYNGTYSSYIKRKDNDDNDRYILTSETSKDYLEELFKEKLDPESLKDVNDDEERIALYNAYTTISKLFSNNLYEKSIDDQFNYLVDFRNKIENLLVIKILLDDLDTAHIVFDSLNDRGKPIDVADKVKSYLMRLLKKGSLTTDSQLSKWNNLQIKINTCKRSNILNEFIEYHFKSFTNKNITKENLFENIKNYIGKDRNKAGLYLNELKENIDYFLLVYDQSKFYEIFDKSNIHSKDIKRSIISLNNYGIKMHIPLLMLLIREYCSGNITPRNISMLLKKIDKFHFRYNAIYSFPTNALSPQYRKIISDIIVSKDKNNTLKKTNLISSIKHNIYDKNSFVNNFKNRIKFSESDDKNKKIVKDILIKIDLKYKKSNYETNYDEMTIEHLIPQAREKDYNVVSQIGNLILITHEMQRKLGTKPYNEKIKILEDQGYFNNYKNRLFLPEIGNISGDIRSHVKNVNERTNKIIDILYKEEF